jgi:tetratricopeptide (TPR) repeat protein
MSVEPTVFISYRRTNYYIARAVYQDLRTHQYDIFLDYQNIDSGSFERVILSQIAARAHFILILTPSALERCAHPDDWVRREIEHAIETKRNIVPLLFEEFDFAKAQPYLLGKLEMLGEYNAIRVPQDYFEEAMTRLRTRFLSKPLEVILHPVPAEVRADAAAAIAAVDAQPNASPDLISAESQYERGNEAFLVKEYEAAIDHLNEAIRLNPDYAHAYFLRGDARMGMGDTRGAIEDYTQTLQFLKKGFHNWKYDVMYHRATAYHALNLQTEALADYNETLRLRPPHVGALTRRADLLLARGDLEPAIHDYEKALQLDPTHDAAKQGLAHARQQKAQSGGFVGRITNALKRDPTRNLTALANEYFEAGQRLPMQEHRERIAQFNEAIRLNPKFVSAYFARASTYHDMRRYEDACADYTQGIELRPRTRVAYMNRAECYLALNKPDEALADYEEAQKLGQHTSMVKAGIALVHQMRGDMDKARELWQQLINLDKRYRDADFAKDKLNWSPELVEMARKLIAQL